MLVSQLRDLLKGQLGMTVFLERLWPTMLTEAPGNGNGQTTDQPDRASRATELKVRAAAPAAAGVLAPRCRRLRAPPLLPRRRAAFLSDGWPHICLPVPRARHAFRIDTGFSLRSPAPPPRLHALVHIPDTLGAFVQGVFRKRDGPPTRGLNFGTQPFIPAP
jgi:hypothetical protein